MIDNEWWLFRDDDQGQWNVETMKKVIAWFRIAMMEAKFVYKIYFHAKLEKSIW